MQLTYLFIQTLPFCDNSENAVNRYNECNTCLLPPTTLGSRRETRKKEGTRRGQRGGEQKVLRRLGRSTGEPGCYRMIIDSGLQFRFIEFLS